MPISTTEILKLVSDLSEEENIKVAVSESVKGGLLTGASTAIGGIILGPIGLAAGGIFGGLTSYFMSHRKFESVGYVIMKMEPSKQQLLAGRIRNFLQKHAITEAANLTKILANPTIKILLIEVIIGVLLSLGGYLYEKLRHGRMEKEPKDLELTCSANAI